MSVKEFLKENFVIVVGVTLPLLLVLFFVAARDFPGSRVADPQYDLIFVKNYFAYQHKPLQFTIESNKLKARYYPGATDHLGTENLPKLYYYDASTGSVREIPVELPIDEDGQVSTNAQSIALPAVADLRIAAGDTAPDGYRLVYNTHSHGGLLTEIMIGYHGNRNRYVLEKDGRRIKLPVDVYYYNTEAIGWVLSGELK